MEERLVDSNIIDVSSTKDIYIGTSKNKSFIPIWASFKEDLYSIPCYYYNSFKGRSFVSLKRYLYNQYRFYKNNSIISGITNIIVSNGFIGQETLDGILDIHFLLCKNEQREARLYLSHQLVHSEYWKYFYRMLQKNVLGKFIENNVPFVILDKDDLKALFFEEDKLPTFKSFKEMKEFEEKIPEII